LAFTFTSLSIPDVIHVKPQPHVDTRGLFMETYRRSEFLAFGIPDEFVQDNRSFSKGPVVRGLHYQKPPKAQAKLVSVAQGRVFDVAVDIRAESPTFGSWVGMVLTSDSQEMLYIPRGFAHGFCVLDDEADLTYKVSCEFSAEHDRGIAWDDPDLGIEWPIEKPIVSARDASLPHLADTTPDFHVRNMGGL